MLEPGVPESFKILVNELQSLGLKVTVEDDKDNEIDLKDREDDFDDAHGMRFGPGAAAAVAAAGAQSSASQLLAKRGFVPAGTLSKQPEDDGDVVVEPESEPEL
jgi:hypothetical protein